MDNLYTAIILFIIALKSKSNQLTILMIVGCLVAWLIDYLDFDIALYYSLNAILFALLALSAVKLKNTSALFYAIIMLWQMFFCLVLIPSWGEIGNSILQDTIIYLTDEILIITLLLGVTGSENSISNGFNNISGGSSSDNNRNHRDYKN
jgi:hypothetical protein